MTELKRKQSGSFSGTFSLFAMTAVSGGLGTLCFAPICSGGADSAWPAAVLTVSLLSAAAGAVYIRLAGRLAPESTGQTLISRLPAAASRLMLFAGGLYFAVQTALTAYITADAVGMYLLEHTPRGVILLAVLFTACTVCDSGMKYTLRCCELLMMLCAVPLLALLALCLFNTDLREAAVLLCPEAQSVLRLLPAALLSCPGCAAVIAAESVLPVRHKGIAVLPGFAAVSAVSVLLYICAAGVFTAEGAAVHKYPIIEMTRSVSIGPVSFTERFDALFISVMLIASIAQMSLFGGLASQCISSLLGLRSQRCITWLLLPACFLTACFAEYAGFRRLLCRSAVGGGAILPAAAAAFAAAAVILTGKRRNGKCARQQ